MFNAKNKGIGVPAKAGGKYKMTVLSVYLNNVCLFIICCCHNTKLHKVGCDSDYGSSQYNNTNSSKTHLHK